MPHNTFIFPDPPTYGWYLSVTAIFLNMSWSMHNVIAWMKNKPFLSRRASLFYIGTVILAQPYWVLEIYANFTYFNNINDLFHSTRPYEALFRYENASMFVLIADADNSDPWWIFTTINLFWNIKRRYDFGFVELIKTSPRFGVLLLSMCLSIGFIIVDILSVTPVLSVGLPDGINPFWKFAFIFKCFTDTIILDDFKTALDKLKKYRLEKLNPTGGTLDSPNGPPVDWKSGSRRRSTLGPWNESAGVTSNDKVEMRAAKGQLYDLDLEMNYWTAQREGESSRSESGNG